MCVCVCVCTLILCVCVKIDDNGFFLQHIPTSETSSYTALCQHRCYEEMLSSYDTLCGGTDDAQGRNSIELLMQGAINAKTTKKLNT